MSLDVHCYIRSFFFFWNTRKYRTFYSGHVSIFVIFFFCLLHEFCEVFLVFNSNLAEFVVFVVGNWIRFPWISQWPHQSYTSSSYLKNSSLGETLCVTLCAVVSTNGLQKKEFLLHSWLPRLNNCFPSALQRLMAYYSASVLLGVCSHCVETGESFLNYQTRCVLWLFLS